MSKNRATREAYGEALIELAETNPKIVALDADLAKSTTLIKFMRAYPDRFFECGIAEQNMMDIAAGLAASGKICFTGSFAIFACGRAFEQIRNTIAYPNLNVKICPTHAGVTVGADGASHQTVEDIALMRAVPNMKVITPADYYEAKSAIKKSVEIPGVVFIRLSRSKIPSMFDDNYRFELGKAVKLKDGTDVTLLAVGVMVKECLAASEELEKDGINAEVINVSTLKPLDEEMIINSARKTKAIVTAEEHSIIGGLGSAVAEVLGEKAPTPMIRIGIQDVFGTSGSATELLKHFGLTAKDISKAAKKVVGKR